MSDSVLYARRKEVWHIRLVQLTLLSICFMLFGNASFALSPSVEGIQIYQNNLTLTPEHKLRLADDISRYRTADNLWDVLREQFVLPHYEDNPLVQEKIQWFMNNQDYLLRSATRAAPYLYYILQQVKKRHLPAELVLLPIVESGYNPFSLSHAGAAGIWQLMPGTASGLGIRQDWWYDGRRDVIASTRAALNYLAYLQSFFEGNWLLAMAAYNTGEGNVLSAIRRNIHDGRDTDFWSLPVAQETRDYVPSLLALAVIISHPDQYPVYFPPVRNAPYLGQVDVGSQINLKYAATLAGISYKKLAQLNPGFNRLSTSTKGPYKLVLPIENVEQFTENLSRSSLTPQIDWLHYKVKSGDTLLSIAKKFNVPSLALKKMNHLNKITVRPGSHLLIPTDAEFVSSTDTTEKILAIKTEPHKVITRTVSNQTSKYVSDNILEKFPKNYSLQPGDTVYMVRKKDSLATIAKRFHIDSRILNAANKLEHRKLVPGKRIIIPTHFTTSIKSSNTGFKKIEPGDTLYMVRRGDTIEKIAHKFHTSASAIRLTNLIDDNSISEGIKIIIPTHIHG